MFPIVSEPVQVKAKIQPVGQTNPAQLVPTIFHEPFWLDITSGGQYREAKVSSGGLVVGKMPYRISKAATGLAVVGMPNLVHTLGPIIAPQFSGDNFPKSLKEFAIISDLIAQLPKASYTSFRLHSGVTNTLAFEAAGFASNPSFTVEISPAIPRVLWSQMRDKTRNVIRRAQECLTVSDVADVKLFLDFYEQNLRTKGRKNEYDRPTCSRLLTECLRRRTGRILVARERSGALQAAVFTVWDARSEYYFMATRSPQSMNGANSLLIWEALQHASSHGLTFDMDGFHVVRGTVPNLLLLTGFGGQVKTRFQVYKASPILHIAKCLRELWKN